jgi:hypothetical protein
MVTFNVFGLQVIIRRAYRYKFKEAKIELTPTEVDRVAKTVSTWRFPKNMDGSINKLKLIKKIQYKYDVDLKSGLLVANAAIEIKSEFERIARR